MGKRLNHQITIAYCAPRNNINVRLSRVGRGGAAVLNRLDLPAFGCGGAGAPNRLLGEGCLSGASSLALLFGAQAEGPPWGRIRAEMVLGTFAKTKVPRRAGAKPRINNFQVKGKGGVTHLNWATVQRAVNR